MPQNVNWIRSKFLERGPLCFGHRNDAICGTGDFNLFFIEEIDLLVGECLSVKLTKANLARRKQSLGIIDNLGVFEPFWMIVQGWLEVGHVVRTADHDRIIIAAPITEKIVQQTDSEIRCY